MKERIGGLLAELKEWGCDVDGALARFLDDEKLYVQCVRMAAEDPDYEALKEALLSEQIQAAFDSAHTLKGVFGNLGLTPLYEPTVRITDLLRSEQIEKAAVFYQELSLSVLRLKDTIGKWEVQNV